MFSPNCHLALQPFRVAYSAFSEEPCSYDGHDSGRKFEDLRSSVVKFTSLQIHTFYSHSTGVDKCSLPACTKHMLLARFGRKIVSQPSVPVFLSFLQFTLAPTVGAKYTVGL